jgi:hypothetical protein
MLVRSRQRSLAFNWIFVACSARLQLFGLPWTTTPHWLDRIEKHLGRRDEEIQKWMKILADF